MIVIVHKNSAYHPGLKFVTDTQKTLAKFCLQIKDLAKTTKQIRNRHRPNIVFVIIINQTYNRNITIDLQRKQKQKRY